MQETLNHLIKRSLNLKQSTVGDAFEVIPIKNAKYAKNTIELHLADRNLQELSNFEKFMNLECLWLNNNKIEKLEGLEKNFRLRELYLHNNRIKTLQGSVSNLINLRVLTLYDNEIRDLDKNLDILEKFQQLTQLDLSNNPVAEEPNYRLRVILTVPSLQVLDRHVVTMEERIKARAYYNTEVKGIVSPKKAKRDSAWKASQAEINLDREAKMIKEKNLLKKTEEERAEKDAIMHTFKKWYTTTIPPTATFLAENHERVVSSTITEWEKNYILPLFKGYDKEKKGIVKFSEIKDLYNDLIEDKGCIGTIPGVTFEDFCSLMKINEEKDNTISWNNFRVRLNDLRWQKADRKKTQERINEYYKEANKLIFVGKGAQAPDLLHKANRLENALSK